MAAALFTIAIVARLNVIPGATEWIRGRANAFSAPPNVIQPRATPTPAPTMTTQRPRERDSSCDEVDSKRNEDVRRRAGRLPCSIELDPWLDGRRPGAARGRLRSRRRAPVR